MTVTKKVTPEEEWALAGEQLCAIAYDTGAMLRMLASATSLNLPRYMRTTLKRMADKLETAAVEYEVAEESCVEEIEQEETLSETTKAIVASTFMRTDALAAII